MASLSEEAITAGGEMITRGSANIFAALGNGDAEERQTKSRLAQGINALIARRGLNQVTAADRLGITQPKVSALANYKLDGCLVDRLMTMLTALDQDVDSAIRRSPRSRSAWRRAVAAGGR